MEPRYKASIPKDRIPIPRGLMKTVNNCEAHVLINKGNPFRGIAYTDHDLYVKQFQAITVECMLLGKGAWAKEGRQAGVMNVVHYPGPAQNQAKVCGESPRVGSKRGLGYAVGPPRSFGEICGNDPATIPEPGSMSPTRKFGTEGKRV